MTPVFLIDALVAECKRIFADWQLRGAGGEPLPLNVYAQDLPATVQIDDPAHFPFIIVRLLSAKQDKLESPRRCEVAFIVGTCDEEPDYQGWRDGIAIAENLQRELASRGNVDDRFPLDWPCETQTSDESAYPFYFTIVKCGFLVTGFSETEAQLNGLI